MVICPNCLCDSTLIPIPKNNKDGSCSNNYRPIALSSSLGKGSFWSSTWISFLVTHSSLALNQGTPLQYALVWLRILFPVIFTEAHLFLDVFWMLPKPLIMWIMDSSFKNCLRGAYQTNCPIPVNRFLISWYSLQRLQVQWGSACFSDPFTVSNGGSVLSPILFSVYLDGLLTELRDSGVGCYWGCCFAGALCYADDVVFLAPSASAMRTMSSVCSSFAASHGLEFNATNTQLIS